MKGSVSDLYIYNPENWKSFDANPLDDMSATENRAGVMLKGKWHSHQELNHWLDESAQTIKTSFKEHKAGN